ncbi:MAG: hypothetical protein KF900_00535 [Bacteroidetes bacterium]|nr:hypothetical protein [Bacteroidota bacterium]
MEATEKEIQCIAISQKLYDVAAERAIKKLVNEYEQHKKIEDKPQTWFGRLFNKRPVAPNPEEELQQKILEIKRGTTLDHDVSETKTFAQLWEDKGAVSLYLDFCDCEIEFKHTEQEQCIDEWFKILYGETQPLEDLKKRIRSRQAASARNFAGGHINFKKLSDILPNEIDEVVDRYEK